MNALLALLLKDRISQFSYVDRLAGMVRAVSREQAGGTITIPVAIAVDDPLACDDSSVRDMVPDERYSCMVYFEDRGMRAIQTRTRGSNYESRLRLVCWVNTAKLNGDPYAGDRILRLFLSVFPTGVYNDGPFIGLRHVVEAVPERGRSLFSAYTYPDAARQYLLYPFDAFAIDVMTTLRIRPGCEDQVTASDEACWTPPSNLRRRFPREFTCEELTAPITGLTAEQLGAGCLDCSGSAPCAEATVSINGTQVASDATPCGAAIALEVVDQDGNPIGSLVDGQWVVTIPEEVNNILPYADEAAALADNVTIPATNQLVVITATGRTYWGDGTSTVDVLVGGLSYLLPVTEVPADKLLRVEVFGDNPSIQLNS